MASVEFVNVTKRFGKVEAVRDLSLSIADGEFMTMPNFDGALAFQIPNTNHTICATTEQLCAIGTKGKAAYPVCMAAQRRTQMTRRTIP